MVQAVLFQTTPAYAADRLSALSLILFSSGPCRAIEKQRTCDLHAPDSALRWLYSCVRFTVEHCHALAPGSRCKSTSEGRLACAAALLWEWPYLCWSVSLRRVP